ncbi:MAG: hypothetical protein JXQ65_07655 [Candidatus Marinimicrobia bacterium]|nr:hypothetical protein [Candidatus Neomarinimicrobiota bacterium]
MKNLRIFFVLIIPFLASGQELSAVSTKTAILNDAKYREIGLFQPFRFALSDNLEFATHPVLFFILPNLQIKKNYRMTPALNIASQHHLCYPTPLLKMLAREGTGGIIAAEFKKNIPNMFSLYNGILVSREISARHLVTLKTGIKLGLNAGSLDSRTSIDLPVVFQRMAVFYEGFGLQYGVNIITRIQQKIFSDATVELFHFPGAEENLALEYSQLYSWLRNDRFQLSGGFKVVWGEYPFGKQTHLLPLFDIKWKFQ